eukprot:TRINITY_DN5824_c0_g1_i1.p1 TRINITY_DN5824_c0_g1~~TRINITY_DN5824_c0_g1_i1.p1  ORF type:complete len:1306 (-),score=362.37 TRINITY_DN5824_c0_g1_i1:108-4025(-)
MGFGGRRKGGCGRKGGGGGPKGRRPGGKGKGRHRASGGKGCRGGGKSAGGPGRYLAGSRPPGAPLPLPEDPVAPFLHPTSRPLVRVPLEFPTLRQWCDIIGNNILAEFWQVYKECSCSFTGYGVAAGDELIIDNAPADGFSQCLLLVNRQPRLATSQRVLGVGKVAVKLRGGSAQSGQVKSLGYVGSYLAEFAACLELRRLPPAELTGPMRAILEPKVDIPGDYAVRKLRTHLVPVNPSQRAAVENLRWALEKIQGPPGTGKSTTIFHILDARVPANQRVLVTCSRNVAVESIAQKLSGLEGWPLCVFGPRDRVGETARRNLLDDQVGGQFEERRLQKVSPLACAAAESLGAAIASREAKVRGCRGEKFLLAFLRYRHGAVYNMRERSEKLASYCTTATSSPEWCKQQQASSKQAVLDRSRIFLCTIASSSRLLREWEEVQGSPLSVHTVIVDECGCTPESSTALLLRLRPKNLVLVGDHRQLPPCSVVSPQLLEGTGHTRSLLERCVLASGQVHQLREQYRMHASMAGLVSKLFYAGRVTTPAEVAKARAARESRPLVWLDVQGREEAPERSYVNAAEVAACTRACARARERAGPNATIAALTFYRGQLQALMQAMPSDLNVEVLTVDACQGSEFDYVVLSTVRANRDKRLGFVKDQQRINVAISRARLKMIVVGNSYTMSGDDDWKQVHAACQPAQPMEVKPDKALPEVGSGFLSVFDALRAQKQREAEQKATQALEEQASGGGAARRGKGGGGGVSFSAEALMSQQSSQRGRDAGYGSWSGSRSGYERMNNGTFQSRSFAVIGGGFRRRADLQEQEAQARHHLASLEVPASVKYQPKYRELKSVEEFSNQFPSLDSAASLREAPKPVSVPRVGAGDLRPSSLNDVRKQRRAAERRAAAAATTAIGDASATGGFAEAFEEDDGVAQAAPLEEERFEDIPEAALFEMFPDDAAAVEETLLRFAGLPHASARALEALLARPTAAGAKAVLEVEDDLDYDYVPVRGDFDHEEDDQGDGYWDEDFVDYASDSEELEAGTCKGCMKSDIRGFRDEDEMLYCLECWDAWEAWDEGEDGENELETGKQADRHWREGNEVSSAGPPGRPPPPPIPSQAPATFGAPPGLSAPSSEAALATPTPKAKSQAKAKAQATQRMAERSAFFTILDGAPQWAEAPPRPEAGGKELVELASKEARAEEDPRATGRAGRWRNGGGSRSGAAGADTAAIPAAAVLRPAAPTEDPRPVRFRKMLATVKNKSGESLEESVIDFVVSLVEEDLDEDTKEAVLDQLKGNEVDDNMCEVLWQGLMA